LPEIYIVYNNINTNLIKPIIIFNLKTSINKDKIIQTLFSSNNYQITKLKYNNYIIYKFQTNNKTLYYYYNDEILIISDFISLIEKSLDRATDLNRNPQKTNSDDIIKLIKTTNNNNPINLIVNIDKVKHLFNNNSELNIIKILVNTLVLIYL
jgi:hypothetical protein